MLQSYESGLPYSAAGAITLTRYAGAPPNPGYASIPNGLYYFSERGALRTEDVYSTDLALRYALRIGAAEVFAQGDVLNLFNNAAIFDPLRLGTTVTRHANARPMSARRVGPDLYCHRRALSAGRQFRTAAQQPRLSAAAHGAGIAGPEILMSREQTAELRVLTAPRTRPATP